MVSAIISRTEYDYNAENGSCYSSGAKIPSDDWDGSGNSSPASFSFSDPVYTEKRALADFPGVITDIVTNARYYTPEWGRWCSRDPIGEWGDRNLYGMVKNRSIDRYDWLGLREEPGTPGSTTTPPSEVHWEKQANLFLEWVNREVENNSWLKDLPDCPKNLKDRNNADWTEPECGWAVKTFHPGACNCIRSSKATKTGAGQQCCYDQNGLLITEGEGAGTPDKTAPIGIEGLLGHKTDDVDPYSLAKKLDQHYNTAFYTEQYRRARPPNQGVNNQVGK